MKMRTTANPRSIAFQLILLFTLAAVLLLACGLGVFYSIVVRHAFAEDNAVLADKISALSADFRESGSNAFAEELDARRGGEHPAYWIRMLDSQGRTYCRNTGNGSIDSASRFFRRARDWLEAIRSAGSMHCASVGSKLFSLVSFNEHSGWQSLHTSVGARPLK